MAQNFWDENAVRNLTGVDELVYRSNLLGRDRSVANWGGGNTSMKSREKDFRGRATDVLWVKGSGSDLATITKPGFTGLTMDDILPLLEREDMSDEEMTAYLAHCILDAKMPRQSIETLLHGFLPYKHVDHTHPDNIIAIATSVNGEKIAREIYGNRFVWVDYIRPGFRLARQIALKVRDHPNTELVVMGRHGLITWGDTNRQSYENTLNVINKAGDYIAEKAKGKTVFGGIRVQAPADAKRQDLLAQILPTLRGLIGKRSKMILRVDDSPDVLELVNSKNGKELALTGAACPDHLVHTKHWPLWVDFDPATQSADDLKAELAKGIEQYEAMYTKYYESQPSQGFAMDDPTPRVILIPGVGMITTGKDYRLADISAQLYFRAVQVMRGASTIDKYVSLTPAEAYGVEYWPLERYKLTLLPPERELARNVAFVTGAASGIGRAIARRFASEGAHVVIADIDEAGAQAVAQEIIEKYGLKRAIAVKCDVTNEQSVQEAFRATVSTYGGVDIVVSNAGFAQAKMVEDVTLQEWQKMFDVLVTGYFLVAREAFRLWRHQQTGGNLIFIASKNSLVPGIKASAYSSAKASELHLARVLAEEGGSAGIRVNVVNPDAVISGSGIWKGEWRKQRAKELGIAEDQIEEHYRKRSTLKLNVYPEDIAEGALFFASARSAKTTGAVLNIDGGIPAAYVR